MAVAVGNATEYRDVKAKFLQADDPQEKNRLMFALSYATRTELIEDTLNFVLSDDVPLQVG